MKIARYLPRFREAYKSFRELEERESWSRTQIEAFQLERLNGIWRHAIQHVPYYRRLKTELGLPAKFQSLSEFTTEVPLLNKTYLRAHTQEFLSEQPRPGRWHRTSGSTSVPLKAFRANDAHQEMLRTNYRYYRMWGHDIFDPMVFLWDLRTTRTNGSAGVVKGLVEFAEDKLRNRLRLSAQTLGKDDLQSYLRKITAFRPSAIYAYSRAAFLLALEVKESGFAFPSLKVINLTSEPATEHMVRTVEDAFGVPCIIQYGCVEFGFVAGQWPDRTLRVREDISLVETVPRNDGLFDLALTSLNNPSFPLLRYDIGDITDKPLELPDRGFAILHSISGRCGDLLYDATGRCLHPSVVDSLFEENYYEYVRSFQIRQRADYSMLALIELIDASRIPDIDKIAKQLSKEVGGCPVEVRIVSQIEQTAAGKHRNVISEINTTEDRQRR